MERATIEKLVDAGLTQRGIGRELGIGQTAVRHWLKKYNLETKTVSKRIPIGTKLVCSTCGREYLYNHKSGHGKEKCNSCYANSRVRENKLRAIRYLGGKCQRCGYDKCARALSFHHKDPKEKDFSLSGNHCLSWSKIEKELDKCVLLCCNCHMEVEDDLLKN